MLALLDHTDNICSSSRTPKNRTPRADPDTPLQRRDSASVRKRHASLQEKLVAAKEDDSASEAPSEISYVYEPFLSCVSLMYAFRTDPATAEQEVNPFTVDIKGYVSYNLCC